MTQVTRNDHHLMRMLLIPVVSEKAVLVAEKNEQVVFKVVRDANKGETKAAAELLFKVGVGSIQILNQKDKQKRFGRFMGRRDRVEGTYVSLKPGQKVNFEAEAR